MSNSEEYLNPYQQQEAVGTHCPDGWTGESCAICSATYARSVKWPCPPAQKLRAARSAGGQHAT